MAMTEKRKKELNRYGKARVAAQKMGRQGREAAAARKKLNQNLAAGGRKLAGAARATTKAVSKTSVGKGVARVAAAAGRATSGAKKATSSLKPSKSIYTAPKTPKARATRKAVSKTISAKRTRRYNAAKKTR